MKYCTHCGYQLTDDAAFCSNCGCSTGVAQNAQAQQQNAQPYTQNTQAQQQNAQPYTQYTQTQAQQPPAPPLQYAQPYPQQSTPNTLQTVAKIFMILGCVVSALAWLIPLCWTIPMTVHYCNALKDGRPVSVGFKVCSLLFVSTIAGILMLVDGSN